MFNGVGYVRWGLVLIVAAIVASLGGAGATGAPSSGVVISQVYGGGGNSGATLKNDFVELFNPGTAAVALTGCSVQYAPSGGTSLAAPNLSRSLARSQD